MFPKPKAVGIRSDVTPISRDRKISLPPPKKSEATSRALLRNAVLDSVTSLRGMYPEHTRNMIVDQSLFSSFIDAIKFEEETFDVLSAVGFNNLENRHACWRRR